MGVYTKSDSSRLSYRDTSSRLARSPSTTSMIEFWLDEHAGRSGRRNNAPRHSLFRIRPDEPAATHRFDEVVRGSRRILQIGGFRKTDMAIVAAVNRLGRRRNGRTFNKFMLLRGTDEASGFVPPQWETMHCQWLKPSWREDPEKIRAEARSHVR